MTDNRKPTIGRRSYGWRLLAVAAALVTAQGVQAQQSILGANLIVNGNAEAGPAGTSVSKLVTGIPGWTASANANVLPYGLTNLLLLTNPAPPDHGFNYFVSSASNVGLTAKLTQTIDVSSGASIIGGGNVKYTASAYLGTAAGSGIAAPAQMQLDFENANGQIFNSAILGPLGFDGNGISLQQQIGLVPSGTVRIAVTLTLITQCENAATCGYAAADSLSLVLSTLGTNPASLLGANLVVNGNAEAGVGVPAGSSDTSIAPYVPGWSTSEGASVAPYGGTGWISNSDPGPTDRGVNLFCGWQIPANNYQDIDVSAAATQIDTGQVTFQVGAWLGSLSGYTSPTLTYIFYDWTGKPLAATGQLGPSSHTGTALVNVSQTGSLPAGTRRVRIALSFPNQDNLADDISFSIGSASAPVVTPAGVVPVYSSVSAIQPGSWISIFGTGLASATTSWTGNFPTTLADTTVTIDSKPAYLWFVSPTQINLQAPDDPATGTVSVVVTTAAGSFTTDVVLDQYAPSFSLYNSKYAAAIVATPGEPGNSGSGYDYIGPGGSALPFTSRPVKAGETLLLYGVGFGPTTPPVPAGATYSGAAPVPVLPTVTIGGVPATVTFAGIVEAGLFQLNVVVPSAGSGDKALLASIGGATTPAQVFITLE